MLSVPRTFRIFCEERFSKNRVLAGPRSRTTLAVAAQTFDRSLFSRYWVGNQGIPETSRRTHKQAGNRTNWYLKMWQILFWVFWKGHWWISRFFRSRIESLFVLLSKQRVREKIWGHLLCGKTGNDKQFIDDIWFFNTNWNLPWGVATRLPKLDHLPPGQSQGYHLEATFETDCKQSAKNTH